MVAPKKRTRKGKVTRITLKDRALLKLVSENDFNEAQVARGLGVSPQAVQERMRRIRKKTSFADMLEVAGLTDDYLAKKVTDGCESKKVISATVIASNGEGMKDANSMSKDFIEVEDKATQHKYIQTGLELKKHLKGDASSQVVAINISYGYRTSGRPSSVRSKREGRSSSPESNAREGTEVGR